MPSRVNRAATSATRPAPFVMTTNWMMTRIRKTTTTANAAARSACFRRRASMRQRTLAEGLQLGGRLLQSMRPGNRPLRPAFERLAAPARGAVDEGEHLRHRLEELLRDLVAEV